MTLSEGAGVTVADGMAVWVAEGTGVGQAAGTAVADAPRSGYGSDAGSGDSRRATGSRGEQLAREHLRQAGYEILETNFRSRYGELDVIARRDHVVVFVEVKARLNRGYGEPFEAVTPRKQRRIRRMALAWLMQRRNHPAYGDCDYRFDVISMLLDGDGQARSLLHFEDAFR